KLHEFRFLFVLERKFIEGVVNGKKLVFLLARGDLNVVDIEPLVTSAVAGGPFAASIINEDTPHRFGSRGEEMSAAIPLRVFAGCEAKPGLMDESSGLKGVAWRFLGHFVRGQFSQLTINEG